MSITIFTFAEVEEVGLVGVYEALEISWDSSHDSTVPGPLRRLYALTHTIQRDVLPGMTTTLTTFTGIASSTV